MSGCPDGFYIQGLICNGMNCDQFGLTCVAMRFKRLPQRRNKLLVAQNRYANSYPFSEEWGGYSENLRSPIYAVKCMGTHRCDNKVIRTVQFWFVILAFGNGNLGGPSWCQGEKRHMPRQYDYLSNEV